jgi:hypothetical protein
MSDLNQTGFDILPYDPDTHLPIPTDEVDENTVAAWCLEVTDPDAAVEFLIEHRGMKRMAASVEVARLVRQQEARHLP